MSIFLNTQTALVQIYAWGAGGGGGANGAWIRGSYGGGGGFTSGKLVVKAGDVYQITVGGGGFARTGGVDNTGYRSYTEGGGGSPFCSNGSDNRWGGWGGGFSGVFLNYSYVSTPQNPGVQIFNTSTSVIIAGGGGGGGSGPNICSTTIGNSLMNGGAGGGLVGQRGASPGSTGILCYSQFSATNPSGGQGGAQLVPGCPGFGPTRVQTAALASQFLGGKIFGAIVPNGGAGGGGWFGGGIGGYNAVPQIQGGGGGGSGYINPSLVFCGTLITGCYATPGCSTNVYRDTAGAGGAINGTGENGRVVITYPGSQIASGGVVTTSSGNTIHTFSQSGAFAIYGTSPISVPVNLLVVGGGGGGGDNMGGGGGGGGVINAVATMTSGAYQITVGLGGTGNVAAARHALMGEYSSVRALTQNSYSYLFQTVNDSLRTDQTALDGYGYGNSRVYFNAQALNDKNFTIEGWHWLFDGAAQISRVFFTNNATISTAIGASSVYFGKHVNYNGLVVFWAGSVNVAAPMLIDPIYPPTGKWVHYAVSRNNNDFTLFRDGVSVAAATTSTSITSGTVAAYYLSLPSVVTNSVNTGTYRGYMSNVRLVTGGSVYTTGVSTSSNATTFSGVFNGSYDSISVPGSVASVGTNDFNLETWVYHTTPATLVSTSSQITTYVDHPNTVGAMYFNGVNTQVTFLNANTSTFAPGSGLFTFEAWIYPIGLGSGVPTIAATTNPSTGNNLGFRIYWGTQGFGVRNNGQNITLPGDSTKLTANVWHHIALTRNIANQMSTWLDGELHNTYNLTNFTFTDSSLTLGNFDSYFSGYIRDVRMAKGVALYVQNTGTFSVPTSPPTILPKKYSGWIFSANASGYSVVDTSGNVLGTTPTAVSVVNLSPFAGGGYSVAFAAAGIASQIVLPTSTIYDLAGDFTVEAWIYPTTALGGATWGIIDARVSGGSATYWVVGIASQKISFYAGGWVSSTGPNISLNVWSHVVVQRTGSTIMFFVNGVLDSTDLRWQGTYPNPVFTVGATAPYIGSKDNTIAGYGTPGYIAYIRFINGYAVYGGQFTPPTRALTTVTNTSTVNQFLLIPNSPTTYLTDLANNIGVTNALANVTFATVSPSPYAEGGMNLYRNAMGKVELATANANPSLVTTVTSLTTIVPYKWYHLAVSRSGTTTRLFVNGTLEATNDNNSTNYASSSPFSIGGTTRQTNTQTNFTGYMHGLRLTNGSAVYTGNFTVPTSTLSTTTSADSNVNAITTQTTLLTLQNSRFIDNSINASVVTNNATTGIWPNTPFSTATIFTVPTGQLTNVQSSGTNINALISRDSPGYAVGSFMLNSANSEFLTIPNALQYAIPNDFTIEVWINMQFPPAAGAWAGIIGYGPITGGSSLRINSSSILQYWINGSGNLITGVTPLQQNKWYHIALQRGGLDPVLTTTYSSIGSLRFNGTNYLTATSPTVYQFGTGNFTVEGWFYFPTVPSNNGLWQLAATNFPLTAGLALSYVTGAWQVGYGAASIATGLAAGTVVVNTWIHLALVRNSNALTLYVNGTGYLVSASDTTNYNFTTNLTMGGYYSTSYLMTGYVSNFRIVNGIAVYTGNFTRPTYLLQSTQNANPGGGINTQAISAASSTALLLNVLNSPGYITDTSVNNVTVTNNNAVVYETIIPPISFSAAGSLLFASASSRYLSIPSNTAFDQNVPFTWESWIYPTSITSGYVWGITGSNMLEVGVGIGGVAGKIYVDRAGVGMQITSNTTITANSWYHVALCYDGTNTRLFLNGVLEGTLSGGGVAASQPLWIGNYNNGAQHFSGYITNFRITKAALYTTAFTPNVPLSKIANTTFLLLVNNDTDKIIDSAGGLTVTNNNGVTFSIVVPSVSGSTAVPIVAPSIPSPALNLYINGVLEPVNGQNSYSIPVSSIVIGRTYTDNASEYFQGYITNVRVSKRVVYKNSQTPTSPLDRITNNIASTQLLLSTANGSNYLNDSSASANTLTQNTPFLAYYTSFVSSQYLTIPSSTLFAMGTNNFTIEGWVYMTAYTGSVAGGGLFGTAGGSPATSGYYINLGQDINTLRITSNASGAWQDDITVTTGNGVPLNEWTHIAFVRSNDVIQLFKNGSVVASKAGVTSWNYSSASNNGYIGYANDGSGTVRYFTGFMSNIRVVKGMALYLSVPSNPLTATTGTVFLLNVASAGTFLNDTGGAAGAGITNTGAATFSSAGPPIYGTNGSIVLNGTSQYLQVLNSNVGSGPYDLSTGQNNFTVECWVKITTLPGTSVRGTILQRGWPGTGVNPEYGFIANGSTLEYWANNAAFVAPTVVTGVWYHVAISRQRNITRAYLNGFIVGTSVNGTMVVQNGFLMIGANTAGTNLMAQSISNIRIIKGIGIYGVTAFTPNTQPLQTTQAAVQVYSQDSVVALSTASYTSLLTLQSNGVIDNSTNATAITQNGGTLTTSTTIALSYNSSGPYINTGSIYFAPPSPSLPGVGSYLTVTNALLYPEVNQDFTVELWINNNVHRGAGYFPVVFATANSTGTSTVGSMVLYAGNTPVLRVTTATYTLQINGITNNNTGSNQISIPSPIRVGSWDHVAITRSNGSAITVFVNGIPNGVGTYNGPIASSGDNTWSIGGTTNTPIKTSFIGYISNFRVVVGTALYSGNFTPPTSPLTVSSGTYTTLLLSSPYVNSGNPNALYSYNDTSLWWNNVPTTVSPARPPIGAGPVISILSPFNNTGSVSLLTANNPLPGVDYSPHSFNMIRSGYMNTSTFSPFYNDLPIVQTGMSSTATIAGYSAWFDGLGSKSGLLISPFGQLHLPSDFNIEFWMYSNGGPGGPQTRYNNAMVILNKGSVQATTTASYEILYNYPNVYFNGFTSNSAFIGGRPDGGAAGLLGAITGPNTWNHIAVSRQGNLIRGFVNGVQGLSVTTGSPLYDSNILGRGLAIGMGFDTTWGTAAAMLTEYTGNLSNLRIIKNQALYTGNFTPPTKTLTVNAVGASGANVAGSITGTTALLMFHTDNPLYDGTEVLFTATQSYNYFAPVYPQSTNPFGPTSNAVNVAVALGGGGGASIYNAKTNPASIGANGGASANDHSFGGAAAPGIMGTPGGGYAGAVSTGTYYGAGGAGAGSSGYLNGVGSAGAGRGGCGIVSSILGTPYYFGGGGGAATYNLTPPTPAGSGGLGGGGGGSPKTTSGGGYGDRSSIFHAQDGGFGTLGAATNQPGGNGAANSGGGGGGGSNGIATYGGAGGSGIVVISYPGVQKALGGVITTVGTNTIHTFYSTDVFTLLGAPLYPQALGGTGGCGQPGGGGGAAGMVNYGGKGGSLNSTGTAVLFGGGGAGGASTSSGYAYGGGGASIGSAPNKVILSSANITGGSSEGAISSGIIGGGALYGGGGAGGSCAGAVPGQGCGGAGALVIVYNDSTSYPFPNPSPLAYSNLSLGCRQNQYPYGLSASTPNASLLVLSTGTTCKSFKTIFPNFVSVTDSPNFETLATNKNIVYNYDRPRDSINVARNITAQCVSSNNIQLTTYISSHDMMMKNSDRGLPATYNTPGNYQVIQEVNKANDPRLVNARVANFIVGVTGASASTGTAGTTVNQYWNGS